MRTRPFGLDIWYKLFIELAENVLYHEMYYSMDMALLRLTQMLQSFDRFNGNRHANQYDGVCSFKLQFEEDVDPQKGGKLQKVANYKCEFHYSAKDSI